MRLHGKLTQGVSPSACARRGFERLLQNRKPAVARDLTTRPATTIFIGESTHWFRRVTARETLTMKNLASSIRNIKPHPFMFALQPVIFLYTVNYNEIYVNDLIATACATIAVTAFAYIILRLITKSDSKAAVLLSFILLAIFPLGQILIKASKDSPQAMSYFFANARVFAAIALATALFFIFKAVKSRSDFKQINSILTVTAAAFLLMPCYSAARSVSYRGRLNFYKFPSAKTVARPVAPPPGAPDIYYIIFDRYNRSDNQKQYFGHDNSDIDRFLKEKGFIVADNSFSNYYGTHVSLSSSLNFKYHDRLCADNSDFCAADLTHYFYEIETNSAARFLKERGYKYYHLGSFYEGTARSRCADKNINTWLFQHVNPLTIQLIKSASPFLLYYRYVADGKTLLRMHNDYIARKLSEDLPAEKSRKFVFAHFLLPHSPYIYKQDGSPLSPEEVANTHEAELYSNQLIHTNTIIKKIVNSIQKNSVNPAVVILQSDEGSTSIPTSQNGRIFTADELRIMRFGILNAIYLPGKDAAEMGRLFTRDTTPVNTFRIVFNAYFGANFEILPDLNFAPHTGKPVGTVFTDVTKSLKSAKRDR